MKTLRVLVFLIAAVGGVWYVNHVRTERDTLKHELERAEVVNIALKDEVRLVAVYKDSLKQERTLNAKLQVPDRSRMLAATPKQVRKILRENNQEITELTDFSYIQDLIDIYGKGEAEVLQDTLKADIDENVKGIGNVKVGLLMNARSGAYTYNLNVTPEPHRFRVYTTAKVVDGKTIKEVWVESSGGKVEQIETYASDLPITIKPKPDRFKVYIKSGLDTRGEINSTLVSSLQIYKNLSAEVSAGHMQEWATSFQLVYRLR